MKGEKKLSEVIDSELETPCPKCGNKLKTIGNKDPRTLFMGITKYIVYCISCDFEEREEEFQKRLNEQ